MLLILIFFSGWIFSISTSLPQLLFFLSRISVSKETGLSSVTLHLSNFSFLIRPIRIAANLLENHGVCGGEGLCEEIPCNNLSSDNYWLYVYHCSFFKSLLQFLLLSSFQVYGFPIPNINFALTVFFGTLYIGTCKCLERSTTYFEQPWITHFTFCRLAIKQQETALLTSLAIWIQSNGKHKGSLSFGNLNIAKLFQLYHKI